MASAGIGCRGCGVAASHLLPRSHQGIAQPPWCSSVATRPDPKRFSAGRISMAVSETTATSSSGIILEREPSGEERSGRWKNDAGVTRERLDEWMRESVAEIVTNLKRAPLLVHVYEGKDGGTVAKAAAAAEWQEVKRRWEKGEAEVPEGVIFVECLDDDDDDEGSDEDQEGVTKAWGVVVQGRGGGAECCGPACYLLKTCRVGAGPGLGKWCTHFCLVSVTSFCETTESQLRNCWLP